MLIVVGCAVLGLPVGSFLTVVMHRVPRGESVVRPRSRCPTCGCQLSVTENIPVISWLAQHGRCRGCHQQISVRYPTVELLTAMVFVLLTLRVGPAPELPAFLYLGAVGVALAAIDLDVKRLPNAIVLPSYGIATALLGAAAITQANATNLIRAVIGMVALFGAYYLLAVVVPGGMGFGDVKLAGVLGLYLGWLGWTELVVGAFASFLLGGLAGLALIATGRAGSKSHLPFGPYMLLGALLAILAAGPLAQAYVDVLI